MLAFLTEIIFSHPTKGLLRLYWDLFVPFCCFYIFVGFHQKKFERDEKKPSHIKQEKKNKHLNEIWAPA